MLLLRAALVFSIVAPLAAQSDPGTTSLYRVPGPVPASVQATLQARFDVLGLGNGQRTAGVHPTSERSPGKISKPELPL